MIGASSRLKQIRGGLPYASEKNTIAYRKHLILRVGSFFEVFWTMSIQERPNGEYACIYGAVDLGIKVALRICGNQDGVGKVKA